MMSKHVIIPIFVPHKGCPFNCIYCNQKNISGQHKEPTPGEVEKIIERYLSTVDKRTEVEIGFFGGSFTGIEINYQLSLLKTAYKYFKSGMVQAIRLSTRPDLIDREIISYLLQYGVRTIEIGVQSLDDKVLQDSCRGHLSLDVYKACQIILDSGIDLGIQTMVGLPGDNRHKALETARKVVDIGPSAVRIYPTLVIKGTYLEVLYKQGKYVPLTLEEAVDLCADLLDIYRTNNINVIRMGLQPTENITDGADVIAGPFHPAFGQLVESRLMLEKIEISLKKWNLRDKRILTVITSNRNISNVIGQKRCNIEYLKNKYGFSTVVVKPGLMDGNEFELFV